jgi:signal transduction histidine kinase
VATLGGLGTAGIALFGHGDAGYHNVRLHVAVDTGLALVGAAAALVALGRFRQSRRVFDLLVADALAVLAIANLGFTLVPRTFLGSTSPVLSWTPVGVRLLGAALLALAAVLPARRVERPVPVLQAAFWLLAPLAVVAAVTAVLAPHLPVTVAARGASGGFHIVRHNVVVAVQALGAGLFFVAAVGFGRVASAQRSDYASWLQAGAIMSSLAWVNYALFPSIYTDWFYAGDVYRLAAYALWLVGAGREAVSYWESMGQLAATEERRRLAHDLHDGLAQELAFIATQSRSLVARSDDPDLANVAHAAERALDESRRAITALSASADETLESAVVQAAEDVAARVGVAVRLKLEPGDEPLPAAKEELLRIVREAVTNAARHGNASTVHITLRPGGASALRIGDDGAGFDLGANGQGFGLTSMRERAVRIGGTMSIESTPDGTTVEVTWR